MLIQNVGEGSSPEGLGMKLAALLKNPSLEAAYGVARTCDGQERAIVASRKGEEEAMNLCNLLGALEEHGLSTIPYELEAIEEGDHDLPEIHPDIEAWVVMAPWHSAIEVLDKFRVEWRSQAAV